MSFYQFRSEVPVRHLSVYPAEVFRVSHGVNEGDALCDASDLALEDVYTLAEGAAPRRLALAAEEAPGAFRITADSAAGHPGHPVYLDCALTFMAPDGTATEALVLVEVTPAEGTIAQVWLLPLTPIPEKQGLILVTIDRAAAAQRLAESAMVAFTRGTRITLADGRQLPIEELAPGDRVLTRDSGPQALRWIGAQTLRATGAFAPIKIAAGTLNNSGPLVVSPSHRLFIYQRVDALGAGRKELLVKAGLLVNGTSVTQEPGGFVEYFQLLFDKHEIIYAEGIAAESLFIDTTTRPVLPEEVARRLATGAGQTNGLPGSARELRDAEVFARRDAADMLRRISAL